MNLSPFTFVFHRPRKDKKKSSNKLEIAKTNYQQKIIEKEQKRKVSLVRVTFLGTLNIRSVHLDVSKKHKRRKDTEESKIYTPCVLFYMVCVCNEFENCNVFSNNILCISLKNIYFIYLWRTRVTETNPMSIIDEWHLL